MRMSPNRCPAPVRRRLWPVPFLILIGSVGPWARADVAPPLPAGQLPAMWWNDAASTVTAPVRWDRRDWMNFSIDSAAIVGTAALLDRPLRNWTQRNGGAWWEKGANAFNDFGSYDSFAVIGAFYLEGAIGHDPRAENTAADALSASIVAAGIITPVLKEIAGRARPRTGKGVYHFRPFSHNFSFPSGHTTQAFAVASVIAAHYHRWWVDGAAYGMAGLVGLARMDHNAHFASDVLTGAVIGTAVGRYLVRENEGRRMEWAGHPVTVEPWVGPSSDGIALSMNF